MNPATLEQLNIPEKHRRQILGALNGDAMELYRQIGGGHAFIIFARGRDKKRTLYKLTPSGPERATVDELQRYWEM